MQTLSSLKDDYENWNEIVKKSVKTEVQNSNIITINYQINQCNNFNKMRKLLFFYKIMYKIMLF